MALPRCINCQQAIRKAEYMTSPSGPYHIVCPVPSDNVYARMRRGESVSYGELADADPAWCSSSPDGTGPHVPDDGRCAECGSEVTTMSATYDEAIECAAELLADGADPEYRRGVVNILADIFGRAGVPTSDRMDEVEADIEAAKP
jgi:hypothetical protein